jgi:uncharacterized membrane protein
MKKTVLAVIGGIVLVVIIFIVAAIGGMAYFVRSHIQAQQTTTETASEEFAKARARFEGQHPMIERTRRDDDDEQFVIHRPEASARRSEVQTLRALAFEHDRERLVRIAIPFWLLRLAPSGKGFSFMQDSDIDLGRTRLTIDDLERHGPGLILDTHDRRGSDVLVWVE